MHLLAAYPMMPCKPVDTSSIRQCHRNQPTGNRVTCKRTHGSHDQELAGSRDHLPGLAGERGGLGSWRAGCCMGIEP